MYYKDGEAFEVAYKVIQTVKLFMTCTCKMPVIYGFPTCDVMWVRS